ISAQWQYQALSRKVATQAQTRADVPTPQPQSHQFFLSQSRSSTVIVRPRLGCRLLQVEGVNKVMQRVGGTHSIAHVYPQLVLLVLIHRDLDFNYVNARFPIYQCFFHALLYESHRRRIERLEDEAIQTCSEVWTHHALARLCLHDDDDCLTNIFLISDHLNCAVGLLLLR